MITRYIKRDGRNGRNGAGRLGRAALLACLAAALAPGVHAQPAAPSASPSASSAPASPAGTAQDSGQQKRVVTVDTIAAVVNSEVITRQELEERMRLIESRMKSQNVAMPPRDQLQKQLLERMIVDRAQLQLAKETGIRVDDLTLDRAVARIAEQNRMSLQEFRNQLERDGIPFPSFREEIRSEIIMQRLREREVDNKVQVTESEIDNFLASGGGAQQAAQPEIELAHILVRIPENASPEQIAQRRQRAEEALQQLRSGADFGKVAALYSDSSDGLSGGNLGWRTPERLPQLYLDSVADLNPGEMAAVKSSNAFHIIKLVGKRSAAESKSAALPAVQQTHVRHILIKVNQVVSSTEARRKLAELRERLDNKAAKFEDLARLYSNDLSASKGGDIGWVYPGDTVPEFERAMNSLPIGQVSEPVESPFGWHLIQVLERKTDDVSQERQRMAARQALRERKIEEATEEWLRQVRDRAYVEYRLDDVAAR